MITLIARLKLHGRRRTEVYVGGFFWSYCNHRSHRWELKCRRWQTWDGYCHRHNLTCHTGCEDIPLPDNRRTRGHRR